MRIIFTRHARKRMATRRISENDVRETLLSPDEIRTGDAGEEIAVRYLGNRELRVVFEAVAEDQVVVITTMRPRSPGPKPGR